MSASILRFETMSDTSEDSRNSVSLYRQFLDERDEILKFKWIRSEAMGRDIGLEAALIEWAQTQREKWKKEYQKANRG